MRISLALSLAVLLASASLAQPGTTFTYQGRLDFQGAPFNGLADYQFSLWTSGQAGSQVGSTFAVDEIEVVDGLFAVELDFGTDLNAASWLQIAVRQPAGIGGFTTLAPRQLITPSPYAISTRGVFVGDDIRRVGIGTNAPISGPRTNYPTDWKGLHVAAATAGERAVSIVDGNNWSRLHLHNATGPSGARNFVIDNTGGLAFFRWLGDTLGAVSTPLTFSPTGNVGVGTTAAPTARLEIGGVAGVDGIRFPDGTQQNSSANMRAVGPALTIVRGVVSFAEVPGGSVIAGSGLSIELLGPGDYRLTFDQPWQSAPNVIVAPVSIGAQSAIAFPEPGMPPNSSIWRVRTFLAINTPATMGFSVLAIGVPQ